MFKVSIFGFLTVLLALSCTPRPQTYAAPLALADAGFSYERVRLDSVQRPDSVNFGIPRQYVSEHYYPDTNNIDLLPERTAKVNIHLMNSADTLYKYHGKYGADFARQVIGSCNELLEKTPKLWLMPEGQAVDSPPRRLRVSIAKDPETGQDAIYDHYDDEYYGYLHKGKSMNRGDRGVIKKYAVRENEEINIFVMGPPRDSFLSKSFKRPEQSGIFVANAIKISGWMSRDRPYWDHRFVTTHEILHALGLGHAWTRSDGCDDTPVHNNDCWARSSSARCDTMTSNNIMDYSNRQEALTPCQIGRVHARMSAIGSRQRDWLWRDWCAYEPDAPLRIGYDTELLGDRDFTGDIYVERGATLRIDARVHLAAGAGAYVAPGATLILGPNAIIHNDCGDEWAGIFAGVSDRGIRGEVIADPATTLLNEAP